MTQRLRIAQIIGASRKMGSALSIDTIRVTWFPQHGNRAP